MFNCPVCLYPKIKENPALETYEICPSCGIEYGYQDGGPKPKKYYYKRLRERWINNGKLWWSNHTKKPDWWNP